MARFTKSLSEIISPFSDKSQRETKSKQNLPDQYLKEIIPPKYHPSKEQDLEQSYDKSTTQAPWIQKSRRYK